MSKYIVPIMLIDKIKEHPNADKLEIAVLQGWECIVQKGVYKVGDKVIYIPIDSILPIDVECILFGPDSKITPSKNRIRTIKIRGEWSQGMVVPLTTLGIEEEIIVGTCVAERLGLKKYEPPQKSLPTVMKGKQVRKKDVEPNFTQYTDLNHLDYNIFRMKEKNVVAHEKIHGTNFRAGWVLRTPRSIFERIGIFLHLIDKYRFVYGSRRVQLQDKKKWKGFYPSNVYEKTVQQYDLKNRIPRGIVVYGEVYGDGIQKGYTYGCTKGDTRLILFDIKEGDKYLGHDCVWMYAAKLGCFSVPTICTCTPFDLEKLKKASEGKSMLVGATEEREGIVVRPLKGENDMNGRLIFKLINPSFHANKNNTDFQ